jgi:hypothetical protein
MERHHLEIAERARFRKEAKRLERLLNNPALGEREFLTVRCEWRKLMKGSPEETKYDYYKGSDDMLKDELRELARECDSSGAAFGAAVQSLYAKLTEARMRAGRGPTGLMITSSIERCTRVYLGGTVMRGLAGSVRLPQQSGFKDTVEKWLPSLSALNPPPVSPPPPAA